jgi:hypothetical protein
MTITSSLVGPSTAATSTRDELAHYVEGQILISARTDLNMQANDLFRKFGACVFLVFCAGFDNDS